MNPITEKVLRRLNHEKILLTMGITPKRKRITLPEILLAGKEEPRIYEVLPAILLYKPTVVHKINQDLEKNQELQKITQTLFLEDQRPQRFYGIETKDCLKAARTYKNFLQSKKMKQKSRTLTIRLAEEDMECLKKLAHLLNTRGVSETIRTLAQDKLRVCTNSSQT